MKNIISLRLFVVLATAVFSCIPKNALSASYAENEPKTWRLFAYINNVKAEDGSGCQALFNIGRHDLKHIAPVKIEGKGEKGAVYEISVNGKVMGVVSGALWRVELPFKSYRFGKNNLKIKVLEGADNRIADKDRIAVYGTVSAMKGPRVSVEDFFLKHIDKSIPEFREAAKKASEGDIKGAGKLFADYVRKNYRLPDYVLDDYLKPKDAEKVRRQGEAAKKGTVWSIGTYRFEDGNINWAFNPTWNGYDEWCYHLAYFTSMDYLTRLYALDGDEAAAELARRQYTGFFENEIPPADHICRNATFSWRSLETGGRIGGIMAFDIYFLMKSPATTDEFIVTYFRSFWDHCTIIRKSHAPRDNWLTNELTGLFSASYFAPYFEETKEWREYSLSKLIKEFTRQIYPDGQQVELSTSYHVGVARQFMRVPNVCRAYGVEPPKGCLETVERMFNPYMAMMRPDGKMPSLNDAGNSSVQNFLAYGLELFPYRKDFVWFASNGRKGEKPEWTSRLLPYAGWAIMRSGWGRDDFWAHMDCGPLGTAHQHEDKGSIQMWAHGVEMIGEAGWYDYDTSDMRKYVLSTRGHNTVRIDGRDQARLANRKTHLVPEGETPQIPFSTTPLLDIAEMIYEDGYAGLGKNAVTHHRKLMFFKQPEGTTPFFAVIDRLNVNDSKVHSYEQIWHLQKGEFESLDALSFLAKYPNGAYLAGVFSDEGAKVVDKRGQKKPELQGWNPGRWDLNNASPIATPVLCGELKTSKRIVTVFQPLSGKGVHVKSVKASGNIDEKTFEIVLSDGTVLKYEE